jgi:hypothetical protein
MVGVEVLQCIGYVFCGAWVLCMWYMCVYCSGRGTANYKYMPNFWLVTDCN